MRNSLFSLQLCDYNYQKLIENSSHRLGGKNGSEREMERSRVILEIHSTNKMGASSLFLSSLLHSFKGKKKMEEKEEDDDERIVNDLSENWMKMITRCVDG